jgi:hypothetical protein
MLTDDEIAVLPEGTKPIGNGLYIRVRGRVRRWLERQRVGGKDVWNPVGYHPEVSVADAIATAAAMRAGRTPPAPIDLLLTPVRYYWTVEDFVAAHGPLEGGVAFVRRMIFDGTLKIKWARSDRRNMCYILDESVIAWRASHVDGTPDDAHLVKTLEESKPPPPSVHGRRAPTQVGRFAGREVRDRIAKLGCTKRAAAELLGVTERQVNRIVTDRAQLTRAMELALERIEADPEAASVLRGLGGDGRRWRQAARDAAAITAVQQEQDADLARRADRIVSTARRRVTNGSTMKTVAPVKPPRRTKVKRPLPTTGAMASARPPPRVKNPTTGVWERVLTD